MQYLARLSIIVIVLANAGAAIAHNTYFEEQALFDVPLFAPRAADASFEHPFVMVDDIEQSQAIFGYLTWYDVDVFEFTVEPADVQFGPLVVSASALPPACRESRRNFPVTALMGPGLPPADPAWDLPFRVPSGLGVVLADNPRPPRGEQREIFVLEEGGEAAGISWFLPEGLSQHCLLEAPWECDFTNTIAQPLFVPGTYQLIIWDPRGVAQDYTASIGFDESGTVADPEAECLIANNRHLHRRCRLPYENMCLP